MHSYNFADFVYRLTDSFDLDVLFDLGIPEPNVNKGIWIAGGAIRRTLLNEPISSDIDYFFRDEKALQEFKAQIDILVAGGAFMIVKEIVNEYNICYKIKLANGRELDLQAIIIQFYSGPEEIIQSFDFTICQFVYDGDTLYVGDYSLMDLFSKRLAVHRITYATASLRRIIKYANQGYFLCQGAAKAFLQAVVNNPDTLETKVRYID